MKMMICNFVRVKVRVRSRVRVRPRVSLRTRQNLSKITFIQ